MKRKARDYQPISQTSIQEAGLGLELLVLGIGSGILKHFEGKGGGLNAIDRKGVGKARREVERHLKTTREETRRRAS